MREKINVFIIIRIIIGCFFVVSGFEKLIGPYQNFLYVVQSYELLSSPLDEVVAFVMPWFEVFLGIFLALGLWLKWTLRGASILLVTFIIVVGQAYIRKLPIEECGCFGELIAFPLHVVLLIDSMLLLLTGILLYKLNRTSCLSLDNYYLKSE